MKKKNSIFTLFMLTTILHSGIENEIGISVGATSIHNREGEHFENRTISGTYQLNRYIVAPRFDMDFVKISDYDGVNSLWKFSVNGLYEYENQTEFTPYGLVGIGYEKVLPKVEENFKSHPFIQGGLGINYKVKDGYKAKFEGKVLQILGGEDENNELILGIGMNFAIGKKKRDRRKKRRVIKHIIKTPPVEHIIIQEPPPAFLNNRTTCPEKTSKPDRDRDGVENRFDQCPNTPCDFSVDRFGCPVKATLRINFTTASANIRDSSANNVQNFANFLLRNRGSIVKIIGHTDSVGKSDYNLALSKRRAESVANRLKLLGVSPARITFYGMGESQPIADNSTVAGKAQNRRIEALLEYPNRVK
jgi:OOP family OmpA-OmpF porin